MTLTAGIYPDVPMVDYVADPCPLPSLSSGVAHTLVTRSPAHAYARHPRLSGRSSGSTARTELGSIVHQLVLGGDAVIEVVEAHDWRTKEARAMRDAAREAGKIPILAAQELKVRDIASAAIKALLAAGLSLSDARREHTVIWQDGGAWCRARPDAIFAGAVVDLKTCADAEPAAFARHAVSLGYHIQGAHNLRGLELLGEPARGFIFLTAEIEPPYACSLVGMGPSLLNLAREQQRAALELWTQCLAADEWPGYRSAIKWVEAPSYATWAWAMAQEVEDPDFMKEAIT